MRIDPPKVKEPLSAEANWKWDGVPGEYGTKGWTGSWTHPSGWPSLTQEWVAWRDCPAASAKLTEWANIVELRSDLHHGM